MAQIQPKQNDGQVMPEETPTLEQWRELGSAEANTWTITPPGCEPMSLSEAAEYQTQQEQQRQEHLRIMAEEMESEALIRAAQAQEENATVDKKNTPDVRELL